MIRRYPRAYIEDDAGTLYVLELARRGCRKLNASTLPANGPGEERRVSLRDVPLRIRRAARAHIFGEPAEINAPGRNKIGSPV